MPYHIGVDIGGTKTAVALFDGEMKILCRDSFPTGSAGSCHALVQEIYRRTRALADGAGLKWEDMATVGVASPGPLDPREGKIILIPTLGYRNEPVLQYVREQFGLPCTLRKDTDAAVYYESRQGCGAGHRVVVYITISTGVGCGICIDGRLPEGEHFCAGEFGHIVVEPGGRPCACGSRGCLEAYASGTAIGAIASERYGEPLSCKEVFSRMRAGDPVASGIIRHAGERLGFAAAALCQLLDPGVLVFGGSVTRDFDVLQPIIERSLNECLEKIPGRKIGIALSDPEGNQTLIGAALYGKDFGR